MSSNLSYMFVGSVTVNANELKKSCKLFSFPSTFFNLEINLQEENEELFGDTDRNWEVLVLSSQTK